MNHQLHFAFIGDLTIDKYVNSGEIRLGGAALNGAIWARRLGAKPSVVTAVGTDAAGKEMIKKLKKEHVSKTHLQIRHGKTSQVEIFLKDGEKKYGDWNPGVFAQHHLRKKDITYLGSLDSVVVMGYPQNEHILHEIAQINKSPFIVINYGDLKEFGSDLQIVEEHLQCADLLIFGFEKAYDEQRINRLKDIARTEKKMILITLGMYGSLVYDGEKTYMQTAHKTQVVDTTGAGDSFLSAFLVAYLKTHDIQQALKNGSELASKVVQLVGAY